MLQFWIVKSCFQNENYNKARTAKCSVERIRILKKMKSQKNVIRSTL